MSSTTFPGIRRAALLIAIDNGGINCIRSEQQQSRELEEWLAKQPPEVIIPVDAWLATLTEEQLDLVCCGGEGEADTEAAKLGAPPFTNDVLNSYFDEVR